MTRGLEGGQGLGLAKEGICCSQLPAVGAGGPPPQQVAQLMDPHMGHCPHPKDARREGMEEGPLTQFGKQRMFLRGSDT